MGILVTGSTIRPRIFIRLPLRLPALLQHAFAHQRLVRSASRAPAHSSRQRGSVAPGGEIENAVVGGAADPLAECWLRPSTRASRTLRSAPRCGGSGWRAASPEAPPAGAASPRPARGPPWQRRGVRPGGVLETEQGIVLHLVQQIERGLEVLFRLAGEAHDDIGGKSVLAARGLQPLDALHVFLASVEARMAASTLVEPDCTADARGRRSSRGSPWRPRCPCRIARMGRGVAYAPNARRFRHAREQRGEAPGRGGGVAVAVHVLAQ